MSISELGSLGEFLGSVILIVSIVYLAIQVRQNTKAERNTAMQNIIAASAQANNLIADNPEFATLFIKATRAPDAIDDAERLILNCRWIALYHHLDGAYHMHRDGLLDDEIWSKFDYEARLWIATLPSARQWYETDKQRLSPAFRSYLDARLADFQEPEIIPTVGVGTPGAT